MHLAPEPSSAQRFLKHRTWRVTTGVVLAHAGLIWLIATGLAGRAAGAALGAKLGGQSAGGRGAMVGGAIGALAPTFMQEYGGIRDEQIEGGKVKAFAVNFPTRITALPDVPTFTELGYPALNEVGWMGLWSTADLSPAIQSKVRELTLQYLQQAKVRQRIEAMGMEAGLPLSPDELSKDLRAGYERQGELLRSIQYKPE